MKSELQTVEHKLKKVKARMKEDEKKFAEIHETVVTVEERCRNMNEIIKFKQAEEKKGVKEVVSQEDIAD